MLKIIYIILLIQDQWIWGGRNKARKFFGIRLRRIMNWWYDEYRSTQPIMLGPKLNEVTYICWACRFYFTFNKNNYHKKQVNGKPISKRNVDKKNWGYNYRYVVSVYLAFNEPILDLNFIQHL